MQTQNMIVLTVEFTRIPLFGAGEAVHRIPNTAYIPFLDAYTFLKVTESTQNLRNIHKYPAARKSRNSNCTLKEENPGAIRGRGRTDLPDL
jgi:hypothetical protein